LYQQQSHKISRPDLTKHKKKH